MKCIVIPIEYQSFFPIIFNEVGVNLTENSDGNKVITADLIAWQGFRDNFNSEPNFKANYMKLWLFVQGEVMSNKWIDFEPKKVEFPKP